MDLSLPKVSNVVRAVIPVRYDALPALTSMMVSAYLNDAMMKNFEPDEKKRAVLLQLLFGSILKYSVKHGRADMTVDGNGVACWLPPNHAKVSVTKMIRAGMWQASFKVSLTALKKLLAYDKLSQKLRSHIAKSNSWHMWAMAVAPNHQGQGISKQLYRAVTDRIDRSGETVYVESASPRVIQSLKGAGFTHGGAVNINAQFQLHGFLRFPKNARSAV